MGKLYVGNTFIDFLGKLKVGSADVQKIYAGSTLVFPQTTTTTTTTSTTTSTTTVPPTTTSTTTSTTTPEPTTTSTTTSTTTPEPTTTSTTTSTTTAPPTTTSTTTSTTTISIFTYSLGYDAIDSNASCTNTPTDYYATCSILAAGCKLYTDIGLTSIAPNGFYSDGSEIYEAALSNGILSDVGPCAAPTTTSTTTSTTTAEPTTTTTSTTTSTTTVLDCTLAGTAAVYNIT